MPTTPCAIFSRCNMKMERSKCETFLSIKPNALLIFFYLLSWLFACYSLSPFTIIRYERIVAIVNRKRQSNNTCTDAVFHIAHTSEEKGILLSLVLDEEIVYQKYWGNLCILRSQNIGAKYTMYGLRWMSTLMLVHLHCYVLVMMGGWGIIPIQFSKIQARKHTWKHQSFAFLSKEVFSRL